MLWTAVSVRKTKAVGDIPASHCSCWKRRCLSSSTCEEKLWRETGWWLTSSILSLCCERRMHAGPSRAGGASIAMSGGGPEPRSKTIWREIVSSSCPQQGKPLLVPFCVISQRVLLRNPEGIWRKIWNRDRSMCTATLAKVSQSYPGLKTTGSRAGHSAQHSNIQMLKWWI